MSKKINAGVIVINVWHKKTPFVLNALNVSSPLMVSAKIVQFSVKNAQLSTIVCFVMMVLTRYLALVMYPSRTCISTVFVLELGCLLL